MSKMLFLSLMWDCHATERSKYTFVVAYIEIVGLYRNMLELKVMP